MTAAELKNYCDRLAAALEALGYNNAEITAFIAGARLCGHLRPSGCAWRLEHCIRHDLTTAAPIDCVLERADYRTRPKP